ncbi:hypothetical protein [Bartonella grahamii]|uniref:hypothetical protein n=1 Tax=Bartonella grahamii TaxID=33045 RepID=UPI000313D6DA|nr:hypothetical protein [Bartonella grahamii]
MSNVVNDVKSYMDTKFEALRYDIKTVQKEARQAVSVGLTVSNLSYFDILWSLSVCFGNGLYRSRSAFAFGAGYMSEDGKIALIYPQ